MASRYPRSGVMMPCCGDPNSAEASLTRSVRDGMGDSAAGSMPAGPRFLTGSNVASGVIRGTGLRMFPCGSPPSVSPTGICIGAGMPKAGARMREGSIAESRSAARSK